MQNLAEAMRQAAQALLSGADQLAQTELRHLAACVPRARTGAAPVAHASGAVRHYLPDMLAAAPENPIASALAPVWDRLYWHYHYPERAYAPVLGAKIAFAEVIGPDGLLDAADIRAGFTFMAPGVLYPSHDHPAHELYVVISGRALWTRSGVATWQDPGAVIVHASLEPHAMETFAEPLLALYSWRGDMSSPARYV